MSGNDPRLAVHEDAVSDAFGTKDLKLESEIKEPSASSESNSVKNALPEQRKPEFAGQKNANEASTALGGATGEVDGNVPKVTNDSRQQPLVTQSGHPASNNPSEDMADYGQEVIQLPKTFIVKYLGQEDASGLWGIKYTRKPVDEMVAMAKNLKPPASLPVVKLEVSTEGIKITSSNPGTGVKGGKTATIIDEEFSIDTISYGVQDLVYTRVFAVIIVRESDNVVEKHPFRCYAFVCDSRGNARRLTLALAKAFQEFSKALKSAEGDPTRKVPLMRPKKLAIDLRSADDLKKDMIEEDSEA